jgi:AbrB family looped-hinge helix DNA binding protein
MPMLSPKRQVTIPKELCDRLHVNPGDELDFVEHDGRITIIKKRKGASAGLLKHKMANKRYSDEESLQSTLHKKNTSHKKSSNSNSKRTAA